MKQLAQIVHLIAWLMVLILLGEMVVCMTAATYRVLELAGWLTQ